MYDSDILSGVRAVLALLHRPTSMESTATECTPGGRSMRESLSEIAACNPYLTVIFKSDPDKNEEPENVRIVVDGADSGIEFRTLPVGNLLSPFLYAVVNAGGEGFTLDKSLLRRAEAIDHPVRLITYVGDHSILTPRALQVINEIVAVNPLITNVVVDNTTRRDEMKRYGVEVVPTVMCNDVVISEGWSTPDDVVRTLERLSA